MSPLTIFVVALCMCSAYSAQCDYGWTNYKDETCIKIFTDLITYDEARSLCSSKSNGSTTTSLVMIKEVDMQEFLVDITQNLFDNFWLGSKYDNASGVFKWEDGEPLTYTNWAEGYPRNITDTDICVQLRPGNAKVNSIRGKWEDTVCQRRNAVICQRTLSWTLEDATREIVKLRKRDQEYQEKLEALSARVVPVGSIYVEYYNQSSPRDLWPALTWEDVTTAYAGLFFRANGGESGSWGATQAECAPRITQVQYYNGTTQGVSPLTLATSGWSGYATIGQYLTTNTYYERLRFYTESCEVRPKNQAIRIWRRAA